MGKSQKKLANQLISGYNASMTNEYDQIGENVEVEEDSEITSEEIEDTIEVARLVIDMVQGYSEGDDVDGDIELGQVVNLIAEVFGDEE